MATGNGAIVIHQQLQKHLPDYKVIPYSPKYEYFPFLMRRFDLANVDLIHTTPDYGFFHARKNTPLVLTFHNYVLDSFMQKYSTPIQRIHYKTDLKYFTKKSLERATVVTAVSQFTADLVKSELSIDQDIRVIRNGIDTNHFRPIIGKKNSKEFIVLFSGNMTRRKGVHLLPLIADKLDKNIKIVCATGLRNNKNKICHNKIEFIEKVSHVDMPELYNSADVLIMPTVREGFGLSVAEAMSCSLPVIASNCSTMPELIDEDCGGYLCKLGSISEFAERINVLAGNKKSCESFGEYNREKICREFSVDIMVDDYALLFEQILSSFSDQ